MKIPTPTSRACLGLLIFALGSQLLAGCSTAQPTASSAADIQAFRGNPQKIAEASAKAASQTETNRQPAR